MYPLFVTLTRLRPVFLYRTQNVTRPFLLVFFFRPAKRTVARFTTFFPLLTVKVMQRLVFALMTWGLGLILRRFLLVTLPPQLAIEARMAADAPLPSVLVD